MTESCFHGHKAALLAFINERNIVHLRTLQLTKWCPLRLYAVGFFGRKNKAVDFWGGWQLRMGQNFWSLQKLVAQSQSCGLPNFGIQR
jgi:hypothetical protein